MKRIWLIALLWMLWLAFPSHAQAQTCTATFANVNFGAISVVSPNSIDVNATSAISCSGFSTPYVYVCLSISQVALPGPGSASLQNKLYIDSARTQPWGSVWGASGSVWLATTIALSGGKGSASIPFYARVFGSQTSAPAGNYSYTYASGWTGVQGVGFASGTPTCQPSTPQFGVFSLTVSATVVAECMISTTGIDVGQVGIINNPINATGLITTICTNGTPYSLALDAGRGTGAAIGSRRLTRSGGSDTLAYTLYTDAARTQPWGDGSSGTSTVAGTSAGTSQTHTVYATLLAPAAVPPGAYVDTVTATITY